MNFALRLFKATVTVRGEKEEVPVWAADLDAALETAEAEYGEVLRVRPSAVPESDFQRLRMEVTK